MRLPERDRRAVAFEMGIQNSGLGLILIFNFFDGLGGMAIVTAWWGIWHIVAGLTLATFWKQPHPRAPGRPRHDGRARPHERARARDRRGRLRGSQDRRAPAQEPGAPAVVALDLREAAAEARLPGVVYVAGDVRDPGLGRPVPSTASTPSCTWPRS